jgi:hypothetical protein
MIMYVAAHEAAHAKNNTFASMKHDSETLSSAIGEEAQADWLASKYVDEHGTIGFWDAYAQVRALGTLLHGNATAHATAGIGNLEPGALGQADIHEIEQTSKIMNAYVTEQTDMPARFVMMDNPDRYADIIRKGMNNGAFDELTESQKDKIEVLNNGIERFLERSDDLRDMKQREYPNVDTSAAVLEQDGDNDWGWGEKPEDVGNTALTMGGDQNHSDINNETLKQDVHIKPLVSQSLT